MIRLRFLNVETYFLLFIVAINWFLVSLLQLFGYLEHVIFQLYSQGKK